MSTNLRQVIFHLVFCSLCIPVTGQNHDTLLPDKKIAKTAEFKF